MGSACRHPSNRPRLGATAAACTCQGTRGDRPPPHACNCNCAIVQLRLLQAGRRVTRRTQGTGVAMLAITKAAGRARRGSQEACRAHQLLAEQRGPARPACCNTCRPCKYLQVAAKFPLSLSSGSRCQTKLQRSGVSTSCGASPSCAAPSMLSMLPALLAARGTQHWRGLR